MSFWIHQLDPVESEMSLELANVVKNLLSFDAVYYRQTAFRKVRKEYTKSTIIGSSDRGKLFYTGLIPKIKKFCEENKIDLICEEHPPLHNKKAPKLPEGVELRDFQKELIENACSIGRGILKAPTGTGKTVLGLALISSLTNIRGVLWLCHTKDLVYQTAEEAKKFWSEDKIGILGDGKAQMGRFLTVATRQTFKEYVHDFGTEYDLVIVDESHHITSLTGEYGIILKNVYAPIRIGLTATLPTSSEALLSMEALIGPVIGEMTINEGRDKGFMANPKIKIIKIPLSNTVRDIRKYTDVYEYGVVRRIDRTRIIADLVKKHEELGDSILIVVTKIAHGELIRNLCESSNLEIEFVCGSTDAESRDLAKKALNDKKMKCVIATAVWKEGISIPNLNVVINAAGGKSEIATIQAIGRGTRVAPGKKEVLIYDFFDNSHHYLVSHFGERFTLYCDNDWI